MKLVTIAFVLLFTVAGNLFAENNRFGYGKEYVIVPFNASFVPGISTGRNVAGNRKIVNRLAVNFIGKAARLRGAEVSLIWSMYTESVTGFQYSHLGNSVGGDVFGLQAAGLLNRVNGDMEGLQYAGLLNLDRSDFRGIQWAGIANIVGGSGLGVQFSSVANLHRGNMIGGQWSAVYNRVGGNLRGVQVSGVLNITSGTLHGAQFATIFNKADKVQGGIQVGLINYANHHNGATFGLISVVRDVGLHLDAWGDANGFGYVGLRSGTRKFHNLLFAGMQTDKDKRWTVGWGAGGHFDFNSDVFVELDGLLQHINEQPDIWTEKVNFMTQARLLVGFQLAPRFAIYGGPTYNLFLSEIQDGTAIAPRTDREKYYEEEKLWARSWLGMTAGIRF